MNVLNMQVLSCLSSTKLDAHGEALIAAFITTKLGAALEARRIAHVHTSSSRYAHATRHQRAGPRVSAKCLPRRLPVWGLLKPKQLHCEQEHALTRVGLPDERPMHSLTCE